MRIIGTTGNEILKGTTDADQIDGVGGSDIILARGGDDTIDFKFGAAGIRVNGGTGFDTLIFHSSPIDQSYALTQIAQVEQLIFVGNAGEYNVVSIGYTVPFSATEQVTPDFPLQVSGGDSYDYLSLSITGGMGDVDRITSPDITFSNWHTYPTSYSYGPADEFTITTDNADYTLYASEFIANQGIQQDFQLGDGNDTVYGSSGAEFMFGRAGVNTLYGMGGNDTFKLSTRSPLSPDSLYDGGAGTDFLSIYGDVTFTGTAKSIEGLRFFNGQYTAQDGSIKLSTNYAANFTMTARQVAGLASDLQFVGFGNLHVTGATTFSAAKYQFLDTAKVTIEVIGTTANNVLTGSSVNDTLSGLAGADKLIGGAGDDTLIGGAGIDTLIGGTGNDTLTGNSGADRFVFNTAPDAATNLDTITDFSHAQGDLIHLSAAAFTSFGHTGALTADEFFAAAGATSAHDASDRIVYDTTTGVLSYDADGMGGTAAVAIATLGTTTHPTLTNADLLIIA